MINTAVRAHVKIAMDPRNNLLAQNLKNYLAAQGFNVTECPLSSFGIKRELEYPNYQWLILAFPSGLKLENSVKETVEYARELVTERRLQGVFAITDSSSPDEIAKLWPTIRIYDVQSKDTMAEAFDQICRTLKYTKLPVPVNESGGQMIHPPQVRTRPARPLWMRIAPIFVGATLIAAVLFGAYSLINHLTPSPTHISAFTPTPGHSLTQPASSPTSDPTAAPTSDPQALFNNTTKKPASPNYALISTDPPSKKDWPQTSGTCDLMNDGYHITASTPGQYTSCMLQNGTYNDFAFQVQMQISPSGDAGGMIFRSNSQMSMFYRFSIDAQGSYVLLVCTQCASNANINAQQLKGGTLPKASNQYTLTVIASKNTIYLYINGQFIVQVTDSTSSSGAIGLYAASINQATTVIFTKAKVWKL